MDVCLCFLFEENGAKYEGKQVDCLWAIGWFQFHTDGASKRNLFLHSAATGHSGKSGAGGLLRDCSGTWICGYT